MKFPFREIPPTMDAKPGDFYVYTMKKEEPGYPTRQQAPTLFGRVLDITKTRSGFIRYSFVKFVPKKAKPYERVRVTFVEDKPAVIFASDDYILVAKKIPNGWFGVPFRHFLTQITKTMFEHVVSTAPKGLWIPYRPDAPGNAKKKTNYPWGVAFEREADAVLFQALMTTFEQNGAVDGV